MLEPLYQFFQNEDRPGDRRVEGCGEAGAGPSGNERSAIRPGSPERGSYEMSEARSHLDARSLATKGQA
jgi:hypothetical protein